MKINKYSNVEDIIREDPQLVSVFIKFGIPCMSCGEPYWGTVEEIARDYKVDIDELIKELNAFVLRKKSS